MLRLLCCAMLAVVMIQGQANAACADCSYSATEVSEPKSLGQVPGLDKPRKKYRVTFTAHLKHKGEKATKTAGVVEFEASSGSSAFWKAQSKAEAEAKRMLEEECKKKGH